jgi:molybdopterin-containing oxidoreductase family iron-sulfur binding subunit
MRAYKDHNIGRMVYVGPRLSLTAANADDFIQSPVGGECWVAMAMLATIVRKGWARVDTKPIEPMVTGFDLTIPEALSSAISQAQIEELARAFVDAPASVALAGPVGGTGRIAYQTAIAVGLLNWVAGPVGQTVDFSRPHAIGRTATQAQV